MRGAPAASGGPSRAAAAGRGGRAPFGAPCRQPAERPASRLRQWEAAVVPARRAPPADWPPRAAVGRAASGAAAIRLSVRSGHDGAQLRAAARPLLRLLGPRGHRRPLVRAQGAEPRGDHHDAGHHRRVLLPLLAHRHPGPGQPPLRATAEERDHLVCALPLGVSSSREPAPEQRPPHTKIVTLLLLFQPLPSHTRQPPEVLGQRLDPLPQRALSTATWTNDGWAPEHGRQHPCLGRGPGKPGPGSSHATRKRSPQLAEHCSH